MNGLFKRFKAFIRQPDRRVRFKHFLARCWKRFLPLIWVSYLNACLYLALTMIYYWYGYTGPWIDRFIVFEIFATALFTVVAMTARTEQWSRRGLGIWSFMGAIVVSYVASQAIEWGFAHSPLPQYIVNLWRAPLANGGALMLYGYYMWSRGKAWDDTHV